MTILHMNVNATHPVDDASASVLLQNTKFLICKDGDDMNIAKNHFDDIKTI